MLRDSIKYGPEFADAYSSLASLLAEQVPGIARVPCLGVHALLPQLQHLLHSQPCLAHTRQQAWVQAVCTGLRLLYRWLFQHGRQLIHSE